MRFSKIEIRILGSWQFRFCPYFKFDLKFRAWQMNVNQESLKEALESLTKKGLIEYDYKTLSLTNLGVKISKQFEKDPPRKFVGDIAI